MKDLVIHLEFAKILGIFSVLGIVATIITFFMARKNRIIKYIPGVLLIAFGLYNLIYLGGDSLSAEEFNRLSMAILGMISGILGLFTGLIIGVITKVKH